MAQLLLCDLTIDIKSGILSQLSAITTHDTLLTTFIKAFSGAGDVLKLSGAEQYCSRMFASGTYTEYFSSDGSRTKVPVLAYPIASITDIWVDSERSFGDATKLTSSDYVADQQGGPFIRLKYTSFSFGVDNIKVTYAGGLAATTSAVPDDLRLACMMQVAFWFQRREQLGLTGVSMPGGSISVFSPMDYLPQVRGILNLYRRMT